MNPLKGYPLKFALRGKQFYSNLDLSLMYKAALGIDISWNKDIKSMNILGDSTAYYLIRNTDSK